MQNLIEIIKFILLLKIGKYIIMMWLIIIGGIIINPFYSLLFDDKEIIGNFLYSLIIFSILFNIVTAMIYIFKIPYNFILVNKIIWLLLNILTLLSVTLVYEEKNDAGFALMIIMIILNFPLTIIIYFILSFFLYGYHSNYTIDILIPWGTLMIMGYIIWFIVFPKIFTRS